MTEYDYIKSPCSVDRLTQEIQQSSIIIALDHINLLGSTLSIFFKSDLPASDKSTLDTLVSNHNGIPLPNNQSQLVNINSPLPPISAKTIVVNGITKNIFKRFTGISQPLNQGSNTFMWTQANFPWVKFLGVEVIGAELGDTCDLYVLDTTTGTYSGVPNYQLNQFGFTVNVGPSFYKRESSFDADMYQGLQIKFVYNSVSAKTVYINFDMNEVK